jgi:coenzyme F420-reducing hydrogenase alpha subunit
VRDTRGSIVSSADGRREIAVDYLARVEGEGAMYLELDGEDIVDLKFKIFEPPRFFEAFLRGRRYAEAPDITARICGICPMAYMTSAANAMEDVLGLEVGGSIRELRRLIYCGEWLESHALHVYLLHAPDFLGYESGIHLAQDHPEIVQRGLRLKKLGNDLLTLLGGREVHPINPRVGGFYKVPSKSALEAMVPELEWGLQAAVATTEWVGGFHFPAFERDHEYVALRRPDEYAVVDGRVVSTRGIDIPVQEWGDVFEERHVEWSNALHSVVKERGSYFTGPLARYNLNYELLAPSARSAAERAGLGPRCLNPFQSIVVRSVEMVQAAEDALAIIDAYRPPPVPYLEAPPRAGVGHGASEAPRGVCYHRYELDGEGIIRDAKIVPPTSQNQMAIEDDLRAYVPGRTHLADEELQWQLEQAIRNYDPCISCATHFLRLDVRRR